jgi:hypothetical protein
MTEGRLWVRAVSSSAVVAICRGNGEVYACGWDSAASWWCECLARTRCSHLFGLEP